MRICYQQNQNAQNTRVNQTLIELEPKVTEKTTILMRKGGDNNLKQLVATISVKTTLETEEALSHRSRLPSDEGLWFIKYTRDFCA